MLLMCLSYPFWKFKVYYWMLSHDLLCTWYYTRVCLFLPFWCHSFPVFFSGIKWVIGSGVSAFIFPNLIFDNLSLFGVTVKCWLLIGWKIIYFCLVHWLEFIWVWLYNRHPQRFCIGDWIWLRGPFRLGSFLVHCLEFLLAYLPD